MRLDLKGVYAQLDTMQEGKSGVEDLLSQERSLSKQRTETINALKRTQARLEGALAGLDTVPKGNLPLVILSPRPTWGHMCTPYQRHLRAPQ